MSIKAIETEYNGYLFRSRLEARWAVFFDELNVEYKYEPEGFDLGNGVYYLPDFYLPDINAYVEIKGVMNEVDYHKIEQFAIKGNEIYVLSDIPYIGEENDSTSINFDNYEWLCGNPDVVGGYSYDHRYLPCVCPACGRFGIEFDGRGWRICGHLYDVANYYNVDLDDAKKIMKDHNGEYLLKSGIWARMKYPNYAGGRLDDKGYTFESPMIQNALKKARQARFEHGEKPTLV